ncbi:MAG: hypothetical protein ABIT76_11695 [Chthoniobacterales bacterium]
MEVNRIFTKKGPRHSSMVAPKVISAGAGTNNPCESEARASHEAVEVSLCDEGMCFSSKVRHNIGAVLLVDFAPAASDNDDSLRSEAIVVDCQRSACGTTYDITVIFTGN